MSQFAQRASSAGRLALKRRRRLEDMGEFKKELCRLVSSQSLIICCCILWSLGCCNPEYLLHPYGIYCCDYPFLNFALQRVPCDTGVCCPIPPIPERPTVFSSQNSQEPSNVDSITSSLPITECPATMKCVREDFCDAKGVMVPFRVSLTEQEKRQRGTLIVSFSSFFSTATITH